MDISIHNLSPFPHFHSVTFGGPATRIHELPSMTYVTVSLFTPGAV